MGINILKDRLAWTLDVIPAELFAYIRHSNIIALDNNSGRRRKIFDIVGN